MKLGYNCSLGHSGTVFKRLASDDGEFQNIIGILLPGKLEEIETKSLFILELCMEKMWVHYVEQEAF